MASQLEITGDDVIVYFSQKGEAKVSEIRLPKGTLVKDKGLDDNGRHRIRVEGIEGLDGFNGWISKESYKAATTETQVVEQTAIDTSAATTAVDAAPPAAPEASTAGPVLTIAEDEKKDEPKAIVDGKLPPVPMTKSPKLIAEQEAYAKRVRDEAAAKAAADARSAEADAVAQTGPKQKPNVEIQSAICFSNLPDNNANANQRKLRVKLEQFGGLEAMWGLNDGMTKFKYVQKTAPPNASVNTEPWVIELRDLPPEGIEGVAATQYTPDMSASDRADKLSFVTDFIHRGSLKFTAKFCSNANMTKFSLSLIGLGPAKAANDPATGLAGAFEIKPTSKGIVAKGYVQETVIDGTFARSGR